MYIEKSSWLGMTRGYATTASGDGQWVWVRCSLSEVDADARAGPQCRLTIVTADKVCRHPCPYEAVAIFSIGYLAALLGHQDA
jgi:hypothetical protein